MLWGRVRVPSGPQKVSDLTETFLLMAHLVVKVPPCHPHSNVGTGSRVALSMLTEPLLTEASVSVSIRSAEDPLEKENHSKAAGSPQK